MRTSRVVAWVALSAAAVGAHAVGARTVGAQPTAALRGTAYDSLARAPLAGATVQLAPAGDLRSARAVIADSLGRFRFDTLAAGRYLIGFVHPTVMAVGLEMPLRAVDVDPASAETVVELALPGGPTLRRVLCGESSDSTGAIVGVARDAHSELPLPGVTVDVLWREFRIANGKIESALRREPVKAGDAGVFVVCGAPSDVELALHATAAGGRSTGDVMLRVPPRGLLRQDLALGDSARGARAAGAVVDERGRPVDGATVVVLGAGVRAAVSPDGAFQLDGLPTGTWTVEARAIGYEPARAPVALARGAESRARFVLRPHVSTLDRVNVYGKGSRRYRGMDGFFRRRDQAYHGTFLTQEELEHRRAFYVTGMLMGIPGLDVQPSANGSGAVLRGRGGCRPDVFVDGTYTANGADEVDRIIGPYELLAVEAYPSIADTPAEFVPPQGGKCGAVLLWTKR